MTTTVQHTPDCLAYQAREAEREAEAKLLLNDWLAKWGATYHQKCGGAGGFTIPQTWDEPSDFESCACVEDDGVCPRCGKPLAVYDSPAGDSYVDGDLPCPSCGWNWGRNADDTIPDYEGDYGPCACELRALERAYAEDFDTLYSRYEATGENGADW